MDHPVAVPIGSHWLLPQADGLKIEEGDSPDTPVKLTASIQSGLEKPISPAWGPWATTVAVQMDQQVAISLYVQLGELIRSKGWPLPPEGGSPSETHSSAG